MALTVRNKIQPQLLPRQMAVWSAMAERKLDGLLITHPGDLAYLTGFTGDDSIGLFTERSIILITDFRYAEQAAKEARWMKVMTRKGKMSEALAKALIRHRVSRVGFETNFTTFGTIDNLKADLKKRKISVELLPLTDMLVNVRKQKDISEIDIVRAAVKVAEDAFLAMKKSLRAGQTENDIAGRLVYEMRKRGASASSFPPIIAVGATSSLPHYRPADVPLENNRFLLCDWGAYYNGYCSDITRTLIVGKVSAKLREIYEVCLEANLAAIDQIRPGMSNRAADKIARKIITKAGYGKYFGHGLGHGIGKDIHEAPRLSQAAAEESLQPGMIVTIEPGIYLPGVGGVRIEDDVLIADRGAEVLTSLDKSFEGNHISL